MSLSQDRQGYIGDINKKSISELKEMIAGKEKLLSNKSFIETLSDKGERIKEFVHRTKMLIEKKSMISDYKTPVLSAKPDIFLQRKVGEVKPEKIQQQTEVTNKPQTEDETIADRLHERLGNSEEQSSSGRDSQPDGADQISEHLQNITLDPSAQRRQASSVGENVYAKIMLEEDKLLTTQEPARFMPNRTLRSKEPPHYMKKESRPVKMETSGRIPEESAVYPPQYKHEGSKLISLSESIQLTIEQQKRSEELAIERATRKLLGQTGVKMEVYNPPATDMNYRQPQPQQKDLDSDDDDDDENDEAT